MTISVCVLAISTVACGSDPNSATTDELAFTGQTLTSCQVIDEPGSYQLGKALAGAPLETNFQADDVNGQGMFSNKTCLKITASNVKLHCRDHLLSGSYSAGQTAGEEPTVQTAAISVAGTKQTPLSNIRIEGCDTRAHHFGIYAEHLSDSVITDNSSTRNGHTGIYLWAGSDVTISANTVERNYFDGILVGYSKRVTVSGNTAAYNRMRGITFNSYSSTSTAKDNQSHGHGVLGFAIYYSHDIVLQDNTAYDNAYHGFAILHEAYQAKFIANESYDNDSCGFFTEGAYDTTWERNLSRDNKLDGIVLFGDAHDNTITKNNFRDNGARGVFADDMPSNNTISNNTFSGNALGDQGTDLSDNIDWYAYTGWGPNGQTNPIFEGGDNPKDPE